MKKSVPIKNKRILFITRVFPPQVGGMERLSYNIINKIKEFTEIYAIVNYKGKFFLPLFIIYAFFRSIFLVRKVECVHYSDATLAILGFFIKKIYKKPIVYNVHGLDLAYPSRIYQWYLKVFFQPDKLICISHYTESLVHQRGYRNTVVIPLGINSKDFNKEVTTNIKKISKRLKFPIINKKIIITVGRLIERKGVAWFVDKVVPQLPQDVIYLVIGEGRQRERIQSIIYDKRLHDRVFLLGEIDQNFLDNIYRQADLFIMPNIHIENDAEGFGFVAIEAAAWGLPVVAANIEGITDAIIGGENGIMVESGNPIAFQKEINKFLLDDDYRNTFGIKARDFTLSHYNWDTIIKQYYKELTNL